MYAAHRAAGGITSIYRQIGMGSEMLVRQILQDHLGLSAEQANCSYEITTSAGRKRTLKLDARIDPADIDDSAKRERVSAWLQSAAQHLSLEARISAAMRGIVIEVRQGYKSKDAKRQNADMANAAAAYTRGYLPVLAIMSNQIDGDIVERYERGRWLVLRGSVGGGNLFSTYAFINEIAEYDLARFFQRNSTQLKTFTEDVLETLLRADDDA